MVERLPCNMYDLARLAFGGCRRAGMVLGACFRGCFALFVIPGSEIGLFTIRIASCSWSFLQMSLGRRSEVEYFVCGCDDTG